jgi:hypothetical protein
MPNKIDLSGLPKTWVSAAVNDEERKSPDQLWQDEPSKDDVTEDRLKRIRFLRKHSKNNPEISRLAERLENCYRKHRCLSGACPECGRLMQRAWVRESRKLISSLEAEHTELVALSLVLPNSGVAQGALKSFDVKNLQRRLKYRLDRAWVDVAIGSIDFSFNEDEEGKHQGFWCPHVYLITAADDRRRLRTRLTGFEGTTEIPRPKKVMPFENTAHRRSYAMKMHFTRRIGYDDQRIQDNGKIRYFRNTRIDRLRAIEHLELVLFLDKIGFADRAIFRLITPVIKDRDNWEGIRFDRIAGSKRNRKKLSSLDQKKPFEPESEV